MSSLLRGLHPILMPICRTHLAAAWTDPVLVLKGMTPELHDTDREDSVQLAAWRQGRDEQGNVIDAALVVTNNRPGLSYHNLRYGSGKPCALAYHIRLRDEYGRLVGWPNGAPMDDEAYLRVGQIGERLGNIWGGRWKRPHDPCHFEKHVDGATLVQVIAFIKEHGDIDGLTAGARA
jgi:D-alanyl-D-alanine carboxypeptidase-like protein